MHNQLTLINKYPRETKTTMQLRKQFPVNEVAQRRRLQAERCRLQCSTTFAIHKKANGLFCCSQDWGYGLGHFALKALISDLGSLSLANFGLEP